MASRKKTTVYAVGDRVAYGVAFLRSTGQTTGELPWYRGTIRAVEELGAVQLCVIAWDGVHVRSDYHDDGLGRVIAPNLTLIARLAIDSALNT